MGKDTFGSFDPPRLQSTRGEGESSKGQKRRQKRKAKKAVKQQQPQEQQQQQGDKMEDDKTE